MGLGNSPSTLSALLTGCLLLCSAFSAVSCKARQSATLKETAETEATIESCLDDESCTGDEIAAMLSDLAQTITVETNLFATALGQEPPYLGTTDGFALGDNDTTVSEAEIQDRRKKAAALLSEVLELQKKLDENTAKTFEARDKLADTLEKLAKILRNKSLKAEEVEVALKEVQTSLDGVRQVVLPTACKFEGAKLVGGACWIVANPGIDCASACKAVTGSVPNNKAMQVSQEACEGVLKALGWSGSFVPTPMCDPGYKGVGCYMGLTKSDTSGYCPLPASSDKAFPTNLRQVCACGKS